MNSFPTGTGLLVWSLALLFPLALLLIPWVFFLLNLRALLWRVHPQNRAMLPDHVWLNFIPVFNLGWFIHTVIKVRDSVRAEYRGRQWASGADFGYNVGLAAGVLWICLAVLWWVPLLGFAVGVAWLVCWIIYWLKTADLRHQLEFSPLGFGQGSPPPYWDPGPGPARNGPPTGPGATGVPGTSGAAQSGTRPRQCPVCGSTLASDDKYCRTCGSPLS